MSAPTRYESVANELFDEMARWPIFDPHSHIDAHRPAARNFDEVLGYHYYTELAHSAGMPAAKVAPDLDPKERSINLAAYLDRIDNTVQYSWLMEIARTFHGFTAERIGPETIEALYDEADRGGDGKAWDRTVWDRTKLEKVFLTNDFDDPLEGWDTSQYVPCSEDRRPRPQVARAQDDRATPRRRPGWTWLIMPRFARRSASCSSDFVSKGAGCVRDQPPARLRARIDRPRCGRSLRSVAHLHGMDLRPDEHDEIRRVVFWTLAEFCAEFRLPFDLMIGPIRNVYPAGVAGGRDLFDRRVSLYDYRELFNHFAGVTFPISTLSPDAGAELVAYSWIFPNVVPNGHWWYSNVPAFIAADLKARLQAVPKVKQIGYYSDAYKLEFVLPKFNTFRRVLAETLAEDAIEGRGWSADRALELARLVLLENPRRIFGGSDHRG